jgi:hypothetical protein
MGAFLRNPMQSEVTPQMRWHQLQVKKQIETLPVHNLHELDSLFPHWNKLQLALPIFYLDESLKMRGYQEVKKKLELHDTPQQSVESIIAALTYYYCSVVMMVVVVMASHTPPLVQFYFPA